MNATMNLNEVLGSFTASEMLAHSHATSLSLRADKEWLVDNHFPKALGEFSQRDLGTIAQVNLWGEKRYGKSLSREEKEENSMVFFLEHGEQILLVPVIIEEDEEVFLSFRSFWKDLEGNEKEVNFFSIGELMEADKETSSFWVTLVTPWSRFGTEEFLVSYNGGRWAIIDPNDCSETEVKTKCANFGEEAITLLEEEMWMGK